MQESEKKNGQVTRTFRAALRLGEDFITLEESITLPLDASDDDIEQAVELGWRIYQEQRDSVERQIAQVRDSYAVHPAPVAVREPDAPASERQREYIAQLQGRLDWSGEKVRDYAQEHGIDMQYMNKGQASQFIDTLKKLAEQRATYHVGGDAQPDDEGRTDTTLEQAPMTDRQYDALVRMAQAKGFDMEAEIQRRFGVGAKELNQKQAGDLIIEWQKRG